MMAFNTQVVPMQASVAMIKAAAAPARVTDEEVPEPAVAALRPGTRGFADGLALVAAYVTRTISDIVGGELFPS